jgi:hypothetical protein
MTLILRGLRASMEPGAVHDNHHRPHTGIDDAIPADRVHNLTGKKT